MYFKANELMLVEDELAKFLKDFNGIQKYRPMPVMAEQDIIRETVQGELTRIAQMMGVCFRLAPKVIIEFGTTSVDISVYWDILPECD